MLFLTFVLLLAMSQVDAVCKPGWQNWGGRCYFMSSAAKNWWDAKQDCIRRGGRLFEPRNKEVNELVYSNVPGPTKCYWIGISDIEHEDKYVYASDDKPILWTNFRPGFPVSNNSRNCLLYSCDRSYPFQFWDYGCEVPIRYVCEEVVGNSDCGVPDTFMIEESFKTADVESCRSICQSISACTFFTFSAQTLACGIKTYVPGGMIDFQNIETGSPYMTGTLRNKLFVGKHSRTQSAKDCQKSCARDIHCTSWTWSTSTHSVPGICAHNYGEVRGKMTVPGSHVVSGPKCCHGSCITNSLAVQPLAARSTHVQYLLLDNRGDPKRKQVEFEVDLDSLGVLGMPSDKLGVAHQDHGMFVFEEYEKEVAHQMSLVNTNEPNNEEPKLPIDQWIISGVKKVFDKKN